MKINFKDFVGKRILLGLYPSAYTSHLHYLEVTVLEISNSGKVKLKFENGSVEWSSGYEYEWMEELN